jgi:nucleoid DNA-binding protein
MRLPNRDKLHRELIRQTAVETETPISEVEDTIEFYFRTLSQVIAGGDDIHVDYIGDLKLNHKMKQKATENKQNATKN